jgi:hypothetical protein
MSIDIKTANIEPVRLTFDHLEARIGKGKSATRYQEAVHDFQMTQNFHYRPTWEPEMELFDVRRTKIQLDDFDALTDPRQYYAICSRRSAPNGRTTFAASSCRCGMWSGARTPTTPTSAATATAHRLLPPR